MAFTKLIRLLIFTFSLTILCSCQRDEPCTIQYEQSPEIRGFRLGMSVSDIQRRFPGFPTPEADELGLATVEISNRYSSNTSRRSGEIVTNFVNASQYPELAQLKYVQLKLLDNQVVEINIYYPNDLNWKSADEFARKTGEALKLNGTWRKVGKDDSFSSWRSLHCGDALKGFNVIAGMRKSPLVDEYSQLPFVQLEDFWRGEMELYKRRKDRDERRKADEQQRKNTFKP